MDALKPFKTMLLRQAAYEMEQWILAKQLSPAQTVAKLYETPPILVQIIGELSPDSAQWEQVRRDPKTRLLVAKITHNDYDTLLDELGREGGPCEEHAVALAQSAVRRDFNRSMDQFRDWILHPNSPPLGGASAVSSS